MGIETSHMRRSSVQLPAATMQAMTINHYGDANQLQAEEMPVPRPHDNQLLIRVHAASVNPVDWKLRQGQLRWLVPLKFPAVLGFDVSGVVAAAGTEATAAGWQVGDQVCSFLDQRPGGAYASYVVAGAEVTARKPPNFSHEEAAAVPLAAITAWQALREIGKLKAGQRVLINGASGGVGTYAVQLARILGAKVTGTCSESNRELVSKLGAKKVIDYTKHDFTKNGRKYDIVFDAVAKSSYHRCRKILKPTGCYVSTLPSLQTVLYNVATQFTQRRCQFVIAKPNGDQLRQILQFAEEFKLTSILDQVIPLEHAAEAHRISEQGHVCGKLVLSM